VCDKDVQVECNPFNSLEVWADDHSGKRRLDHGPNVGQIFLSLHGSLLTWTNDGAERTARIN
jgi:hypothetical protein